MGRSKDYRELYKYREKEKEKIKAKKQEIVVPENLGTLKIKPTISSITAAIPAIFEFIREMPGFEYLKSMSIGELTTKFNVWIASLQTNNFDGMSEDQIYNLALRNVKNSADTYGLLFSAVLEFVIQHPTVTIVGIGYSSALAWLLIKKIYNGIKPKDYEICSKNTKLMSNNTIITKNNFGTGRVMLTINGILNGFAALVEGIRETPYYEYLKSMGIGNITTKFNTWVASLSNSTSDFTGLSQKEIFELGKQAAIAETNESANSLGLSFASVLEFFIQHPTAVVVTATTSITLGAMFINYIKEKRKNNIPKIEDKKSPKR